MSIHNHRDWVMAFTNVTTQKTHLLCVLLVIEQFFCNKMTISQVAKKYFISDFFQYSCIYNAIIWNAKEALQM